MCSVSNSLVTEAYCCVQLLVFFHILRGGISSRSALHPGLTSIWLLVMAVVKVELAHSDVLRNVLECSEVLC